MPAAAPDPPMPRLLAAALVLTAAAAARAQPPEPAVLRGDSPQTRKRLAEAETKLLAGKAADAADDLQRVLDEAGDDLLSMDGKQFRPARLVAHGLLARLPAAELKAYQDRIDAPARQLLDAAKATLDPRPLWQLADRYFVSRPAQEGGRLLGDLLFERGEFRAAETVWRRLLPDAGGDVVHPTAPADPAAVRARVVLAVAFQHEPARAAAELAAFEAKHPGAAGHIAGKDGPFAAALKPYVERPPHLALEAPARDWPTFGGDPGRTGRVPGPVPYHWPWKETWKQDLRTDRVDRFAPGPRLPFGHPVIVGGTVYVSDGGRVLAFDLRTGGKKREATPHPGGTLSALDGRLFARFGPAAVRPPEAKGGRGDEPVLAALDPAGKELWRVRPPAGGEGRGPAAWEGAPLAAGGRLWAAFARFDGGRLAHGVACFDPADADAAPDRPAWAAEVSDSPLSPGAEGRVRQELVTRAGRNVVLATNAGAVVALDAVTGKRAWAFAYPRAGKRLADANRSPDPAPAVAAGGRVFVAPADADRVYALDAETGKLLWDSTPVDGAQILGVAAGRVVVTITGPVKGVRGLSVADGSFRYPDGWAQHEGGALTTFGRGLVTDHTVFWPTRSGLYLLDPVGGNPLAPPLRSPTADGAFGNLAYADGVLVVVTPTEVWGYEAIGPRPGPRIRPDPAQRLITAIDRAETRLAAGDEPAARNVLIEAATGDLPPAFRARAAARLFLLTPPGTDEASAPADVRSAIDATVKGEWVVTADGALLTLRELIDRHAGTAAPARPPPASLPAAPADAPPPLGPRARVAKTVPLPPAFPLLPIPGATAPPAHLFAAAGDKLVAVPFAGEPRTVHAPDRFTHAADLSAGFVAAGPFAVAVYADRAEPAWVFRVPETDPLPDRPGRVPVRTEPPGVPQLSAFALAGDRLLARLGEYHLIGIDLPGRRVGWVLGGHGRARYEPVVMPGVPAFGPHPFTNGADAWVQLSDGKRWHLDARTGVVRHRAATAGAAWAHPPAELDGGKVAFSDGPGLVRVVRPGRDRPLWSFRADGETGLSGEPPGVRAWGAVVLAAVRRNHGCDLDRLDPADGGTLWDEPAFLDAARLDLAAADADAERVYVPAGGVLTALALEDGSVAWKATLPRLHGAAGWRVRAGTRAVVAYPTEAIPAEPVAAAWGRISRSFLRTPAAWRLPHLADTLAGVWADRTVPVLLFDPATGDQIARLTLPARGPGVAARFAGDAGVVATGAGVTWLR